MNTQPRKAPVFNTDKELADFLLENVSDSLKQAIKVTVSIMIKAEMEALRREVQEKLSFNGYYDRTMISTLGKIQGIPIPRFRESGGYGQYMRSFSVFDDQKEQFQALVAEMHRTGISTRKIETLCKRIFGVTISKNQTSRIHAELAEQESLQINAQLLADEFTYLLLDGVWVTAKQYGLENANKSVLLCALGITHDGKRKIIGFKNAAHEDADSWGALLEDLRTRGLTGGGLKLIIADDNGGLTKALAQYYPATRVQVCIAHKMRNVIGKTKYKNRPSLIADLTPIYQTTSKDAAIERMKQFAKRWYVAEPAAVASLRYDFEKTTTYFQFPKEIWKQIRTTNILEREFREVRRRIKVFDSSFNGTKSLMRYGNSIFDYLNNHYPAALHTKS